MLHKLFFLFSARERLIAGGLLVMMAVGAGLEVVGIGMVVPLVAMVTTPDVLLSHEMLKRVYEWTHVASPDRFALLLLTCFVILILTKNLYLALLAFLQFRFVYAKQSEISRRLFAGYLMAPYALHLHRHSSEVTRNLVTEVNSLFTGIVIPLLTVGAEGTVLLLLVLVLVFAMPQATLIVLGIGAIILAAVYGTLRSLLGRYGVERASRSGKRIQAIGDALGGLKEVKVLGRESFFIRAFVETNDRYLDASRVFATINAMPRLLVESLAIGLLAGAVLALVAVDNLGSAATAAALLFMVALRLMPAATRILAAVASVRFYAPALERVQRDLETLTRNLHCDDPAARNIPPVAAKAFREIAVQNVTFTYPGASKPALDDLSLAVTAGSVCALVGPSGAGKSTLADLILGVFEPQAGIVLVDGFDVRAHLNGWRRYVGYVPQTVHLLDNTVRRNVAFGIPDQEIDDSRVWSVLRAAQLDHVVRGLPSGLEEMIGEHGARLSGGQRQRLGIARALYSEPQVLVLDEATSALDLQTESAVADTVLGLRGSKTVLIIAHRLHTIMRCDRLFYLAEGRLQDSGSYEDLVARCPRFAALVGESPASL